MGDVDVVDCNGSISLTWSAPFSLDVVGVEPDIWYSVLITNVTDEDSPTAVSCTGCLNLTQPHYTFSPEQPSPCHNYNFTIIPLNGAGEGSRSQAVCGTFLAS